MAAPLDSYVARVCWNETGWVRPDGTAGAVEHDTYASRMGFGHEEWLFNFAWRLDGWKYGFLQPVNKSRAKLEGRSIDVRLYTISPDAYRFYVGHLKACEVLDEATAAAARHEFKKRGWFQSMVRQVKHVGGDDAGLKYDDAVGLFNIRYRQTDAILYDPMVPAGARDGIHKLQRYMLVRLDGALKALENQWARRVGTVELRPTGKQLRGAVPARDVDLVHNELQNALFELLKRKFGEDAVEMEKRFADVWLRRHGKVTLIEVKSDSRPRFAIREALGQLLEYGYVARQEGDTVTDLVVAGSGELRAEDRAYLQHLREERHLPISYVCVQHVQSDIDL